LIEYQRDMTPQDQWNLQKERALAWLRVGFALVAVIVVQLNPSRVARFPVLSLSSLWTFLGYSIIIVYLIRKENLVSKKIGLITTCLDLIWISAIVFSTGGSRTPFFIYFSFPVITSSSRWGVKASLSVAAISVALYAAARFSLTAESREVPLGIDTFVVRSIYIFVLACLFGVLSEFENKQNRKLLALSNTAGEVAKLEERRRIGQELHDGLLQALATHLLRLEICRKHLLHSPNDLDRELQSIEDHTRDAMKVIRRFLAGKEIQPFPPGMLLDRLRDDLKFLRDGLGLSVTLETAPEDLNLPAETELTLYYVLREALMNITRHSHASRADVVLTQAETQITGCLTDDGIGFNPAETNDGGGMGLPSMAERLKKAGGGLEIQSAPGKGARISFILPFPDRSAQLSSHSAAKNAPGVTSSRSSA
jgi:two-component system, NarL family, sensor histidine kinase DegS